MDTLFFAGIGLCFLLFGIYIKKRHKSFISKCVTTDGEIVDVHEKTHTTKGALGGTSSANVVHAPIVEYTRGKKMRFEAEVDIRQHGLKVGDSVSVFVDSNNPKIAKLKLGSAQSDMLMNLCIFAGLVAIGVGVFLFDSAQYRLEFLKDPFTLGIACFVLLFAYLKLWPMIQHAQTAPIYEENAEEAE